MNDEPTATGTQSGPAGTSTERAPSARASSTPASSSPASGYLACGLPFDRFGAGTRDVVVFAGLSFENIPTPKMMEGAVLGPFRFLEKDHRKHVPTGDDVSRRILAFLHADEPDRGGTGRA